MQTAPRNRRYSWPIIGISLVLGCLTWLVFAQTLRHGFVNYDDGAYVYRNPDVARGLTPQGIVWAFTHVIAANWHPLTVISHMLDCALYGASPAGHHLTNVILHTVAVILLFLVLNQATGAFWRSAFVSGVFAIHPLHVESVAWVAERKDVLSGVFFMLTTLVYIAYARKQTLGRYLTMSILFALGLMSKPMLVTLPFVLLLLDYWPLNRRADSAKPTSRRTEVRDSTSKTRSTIAKSILEKIPILILSAAISVAALVTQRDQSVAKLDVLPLPARIGNAFVAFVIYVWQMIWPRNLAVFYQHPGGNLPLGEIALSVAFLAVISLGAVALRNRCPYFFTGWFWYVGMLVPVIGIVQVGQQAHADRYTYLPQIGLYLAVTWAVADVSRSWRHRRVILTVAATFVLAALTWCAWIQTSHWRDSESLWRHAAAVTTDNPIASEHLADALLDKGRVDEAIAEARHGLTFRPVTASAFSMLGVALTRRGELNEALWCLGRAMELDPKLYLLHYNLGNALFQKGQVDEAIAHYKAELDTHAGFAEGHNNLGNSLLQKRRPDEALDHLKTALKLNPSYAEAHNNFGIALSQLGDMPAAITEWNKTLEIEPANLNALCNLAWVYSAFPDASIRNGSKALELAKRALEISGHRNARIWRLAAAAYAENGQFSEAIDAARKGLKLAEAEGNDNLAHTLEMNIVLFQNNSPLRDTTTKRAP
jgi:protein O-mannosyl-transferase